MEADHMKKMLLIAGVVFIFGCAVGRPTPIPGAGSPAATLYVEKCGPCHSVPHPRRHTFEEWQHIVPLMDKRMKSKGITFSTDEKKVIMGYLKKHSR
jgi:hypothetical protein